MPYALFQDLQDMIAKYSVSAATRPDTTQATAIIADISNEIDVALSAAGVAVPVTTPTFFLDWLGRLNAYGAAAAVLKSMFPDAVGPGDTPAYAFWDNWYQRGLDGIRDGSLIPGSVVTGGAGANFVLPSTYLTRNPDENEDIGVIAEPIFTLRKSF